MMHQQNKHCLVLKHVSLPAMPFDLIKDLYVQYDEELKLRRIIERWIEEVSIEANESAAAANKRLNRMAAHRTH